MKGKTVFSLTLMLMLMSLFSPLNATLWPAQAQETVEGEPQLVAAKAETQAPADLQSAGLSQAITAYRGHPDSVALQQVFKQLRDLIISPQAVHAPAPAILHANPGLVDLGAKVDDAGYGARVWSFLKISDVQSVLVQYQVAAGPGKRKVVGRGRHRKVVMEPPAMMTRSQFVAVPQTVLFRDSQIVHSGAFRDLVVVGNERMGGTIWIGAWRFSEAGLVEDQTALSQIPPFLVQNIAGRPGFSGNDLVLSLSEGSETAGGGPSNRYRIVLKYVEGKFVMEGQGADQGPSMIVLQFIQSLQQNRLDLARAWLSDPKLISIPKYAGLMNRPADKPFKIIAMSAPLLSGARYRVMTFDKNDLIVDVGKVKTQWAIKALFIAPPDPLAQKLVGTATPAEPGSIKPPASK
jgi:hypothetical protein